MEVKQSDALVAPANIARLTAPWPWENKNVARPSDLPEKGSLVRIGARSNADLVPSRMDGYGYAAKAADLELEMHPPLTWRDFPALLEYYLHGAALLPNMRLADQRRGLNAIACGAGLSAWPHIAHVKLPGDNYTRWARVFLSYTQGGKVDGTGYLLAYERGPQDMPQVWWFALCAHEKAVGAGARPSYGWHPGRCTRCGLNMTVDSGD